MAKYTGVVVTEEAGGPGKKSQRHTYYVHVEAADGNKAHKEVDDRYRFYWTAMYNMNTVRENWAGPDRAPKPHTTDILEGWIEPSKHTLTDNLHPVVIPTSWRAPRNIAPNPDRRG